MRGGDEIPLLPNSGALAGLPGPLRPSSSGRPVPPGGRAQRHCRLPPRGLPAGVRLPGEGGWPFQVTEPEAHPEGQTLGPPARCAQLPGRLLSLQRKQGSGPPRLERSSHTDKSQGRHSESSGASEGGPPACCSRTRQPLEGQKGSPTGHPSGDINKNRAAPRLPPPPPTPETKSVDSSTEGNTSRCGHLSPAT